MMIVHKGMRLSVAEGMDGTVEFRVGDHRMTPKAKTFNAACKEGVTWILKNAGGMKGDYTR